MELKKQKGLLMSSRAVEKELINVSLVLKSNFLNLEKTLPPQLEGKDIREMSAVIRNRVVEIISLFHTGRVFESIKGQTKKELRNIEDYIASMEVTTLSEGNHEKKKAN